MNWHVAGYRVESSNVQSRSAAQRRRDALALDLRERNAARRELADDVGFERSNIAHLERDLPPDSEFRGQTLEQLASVVIFDGDPHKRTIEHGKRAAALDVARRQAQSRERIAELMLRLEAMITECAALNALLNRCDKYLSEMPQ